MIFGPSPRYSTKGVHDAALSRMLKLELDLEQVKRVHAEHRVCLRRCFQKRGPEKNVVSARHSVMRGHYGASGRLRKLGCEKRFGVDSSTITPVEAFAPSLASQHKSNWH